MSTTFANIKASVRLEDVVRARVALKPVGSVLVGHCPFHDDRHRPNFTVFPKTQTWCCFACGAQGDVLDFVGRIDGVPIIEAARRLDSHAPAATPAPPARRRRERLNPFPRNTAYRALIDSEALNPTHSDHLESRGFPPGHALAIGYRSHAPGPAPHDVPVEGVPGFHLGPDGSWRVAGPQGILIPVRTPTGLVVGCQIRADRGEHGKYRWLSSASLPGGTSSGSPCHVAGSPVTAARRVWVTEGPLKADLAAHILGVPVLGVAGVANWKSALPVIREIDAEEVVLAFDRDPNPSTRDAVERCTTAMTRALLRSRRRTLLATWRQAKGLDDALAAGIDVRVF